MIPEFTKIPLVSNYVEQNKELNRVYELKAKVLNDWLGLQTIKDDAYFKRAIQWWKINSMLHNIKWDDIIEAILNQKYEYLSTKFDLPEHLVVDLFIEKAVVKFQIEQKNLSPVLTFINKHYLYLLLRFIDELPVKLENEPDEIKKVDIQLLAHSFQNEITIFETQERMAKKIQISQQDADKIHSKKISEYLRFIELASRKRGLLITKLETYHYTDQLEKVDDELAILTLKWEIEAKRIFIDYFKERKV